MTKTATDTQGVENKNIISFDFSLTDIVEIGNESGYELNDDYAANILYQAAVDFKLNVVRNTLKYHIDEYMDTIVKSPMYTFFVDEMLEVEPVDYSHFDMWGDEENGCYVWGDAQSKALALENIDCAEATLGYALMGVRRSLERGEFKSRDAFFKSLGYSFVHNDFYVYLSDTTFEVYAGKQVRSQYSVDYLLSVQESV